MGIVSLFLILLVILISCVLASKRGLLTPSIIYIIGFVFATGLAIPYIEIWDIHLKSLTFNILLWGALLFLATCMIVRMLYKSLRVREFVADPDYSIEGNEIKIQAWKLWSFIFLQLFLIIFIFLFMRNAVGGGSITSIINNFYWREDQGYNTPTIISALRGMCQAAVYCWLYLIAHEMVFNYSSHRALLIINVVLGLILLLMYGSRGPIVQVILSIFPMFYFLYSYKNHWTFHLQGKTVVRIILIVLVIMLTFQSIGMLIGRSDLDKNGGFYYIAMYSSGSIKNFDLLIKRELYKSLHTQFYTLRRISDYIWVDLMGNDTLYPRSLTYRIFPYNTVNGRFVGNVATTYGAYMFDGGIPAVIIYTIIMAVLSEVSYHYAVSRPVRSYSSRFCWSLIIYSYIVSNLLFSFFYNFFYQNIFNDQFLKTLLYWFLINFFMFKTKLTVRGRELQ